MNHLPIIDAGPGLNFFSINKERLIIGVLGPLCAPEIDAQVLDQGANQMADRTTQRSGPPALR